MRIGQHVISFWFILILSFSAIGLGVLAYYVWPRVTIPFEVNEPIEILSYPSQLSLFPGEKKEFNVTIQNHASLNYSVTLDFHLSNATYQTKYVTFSNENYTVNPGKQNLTAWVEVKPDATQIDTLLAIDFERAQAFTFTGGSEQLAVGNPWGWNLAAGTVYVNVTNNGGSTVTLSAVRVGANPATFEVNYHSDSGTTGPTVNTLSPGEKAGLLVTRGSAFNAGVPYTITLVTSTNKEFPTTGTPPE